MKTSSLSKKSPIVLSVGLFFILLLGNACDSEKSPDQVTIAFWKAIAENNLSLAKKYCSTQSKTLLDSQTTSFNQTTFDYGKIIIDGNHATVETLITPTINNTPSFSTFLVKEENDWKVDYAKSIDNLSGNPLSSLFKSLDALGKDLNKQLEEQLPLVEKEINSLGQELRKQIDKFGNELKKALPKNQTDPYKDTI